MKHSQILKRIPAQNQEIAELTSEESLAVSNLIHSNQLDVFRLTNLVTSKEDLNKDQLNILNYCLNRNQIALSNFQEIAETLATQDEMESIIVELEVKQEEYEEKLPQFIRDIRIHLESKLSEKEITILDKIVPNTSLLKESDELQQTDIPTNTYDIKTLTEALLNYEAVNKALIELKLDSKYDVLDLVNSNSEDKINFINDLTSIDRLQNTTEEETESIILLITSLFVSASYAGQNLEAKNNNLELNNPLLHISKTCAKTLEHNKTHSHNFPQLMNLSQLNHSSIVNLIKSNKFNLEEYIDHLILIYKVKPLVAESYFKKLVNMFVSLDVLEQIVTNNNNSHGRYIPYGEENNDIDLSMLYHDLPTESEIQEYFEFKENEFDVISEPTLRTKTLYELINVEFDEYDTTNPLEESDYSADDLTPKNKSIFEVIKEICEETTVLNELIFDEFGNLKQDNIEYRFEILYKILKESILQKRSKYTPKQRQYFDFIYPVISDIYEKIAPLRDLFATIDYSKEFSFEIPKQETNLISNDLNPDAQAFIEEKTPNEIQKEKIERLYDFIISSMKSIDSQNKFSFQKTEEANKLYEKITVDLTEILKSDNEIEFEKQKFKLLAKQYLKINFKL